MTVLAPFRARPRLTISIGVGVAVALACLSGLPDLRWSTSAILGWDATCLTFIVSVLIMMVGQKPTDIRQQAANQDEGQGFILGLVTTAAAASLLAVGAELSAAHADHGLARTLQVALAFGTVAVSWFITQLIFALHYAHEYYAPDADLGGEAVVGGLLFPGKEPPDYWDFLHFAVVLGAACQTADVAFTSKAIRRVGTVHTLLAFTFNTVVLALTINLLAGLF